MILSRRAAAGSLAAAFLAAGAAAAGAACPIELATYGDSDRVAELEFTPTLEAVTVTNSFRLLLDNDVVLDGVVQWSADVPRPRAMLMHDCPDGDVTGAEIEACTVWEGIVYSVDASGAIGLLPKEGEPAPERLLLPDLGPSLRFSRAYGSDGFSKVPSDVFAMKGCQE